MIGNNWFNAVGMKDIVSSMPLLFILKHFSGIKNETYLNKMNMASICQKQN